VTLVANHQFAPGFLAKAEYRRDFSNQRFFLTDTAGVLVHAQTTAELGLVYWWGHEAERLVKRSFSCLTSLLLRHSCLCSASRCCTSKAAND
jgi:hypothetical protein